MNGADRKPPVDSGFYQYILESLSDGVVVVDHDWRYLYVNDKGAEFAQRSRDDLIGQSAWELFPDLVGSRYYHLLHQAVQTKTPTTFDYYHPKLERWLEVHAHPSTHGICLYTNNTTHQKRAEAELRLTTSRLTDLMANIPGVVWEVWGDPTSPEHRLLFVSDYVEKMVGYTVEECRATPGLWHTIVHPDDKDQAAAEAAAIFAGKQGGAAQFRWVAKTGRSVWVETHSLVICDSDGNPIGMRGVTMDMSDRKIAEQKIVEANSELKRLNQLKSDFTSIVSHELRTPLAAIKEGISLTLDEIEGPISQGQRQTLELVKANVDRLGRLINNVLNFSRMEAGQWHLEFDRINLTLLISETVSAMQLAARKKNIALTADLPAESIHVMADADTVKQVLINLLDNAIKFTLPAGEIHCRLRKIGGYVQIEIEDTGIGIRPEDQALIFEMYGQSHAANRRQLGGAGVGLAVCKQLIEKHGGEIILKSCYGEGSVFTIMLPDRPRGMTE